jgi:hypothetical protein
MSPLVSLQAVYTMVFPLGLDLHTKSSEEAEGRRTFDFPTTSITVSSFPAEAEGLQSAQLDIFSGVTAETKAAVTEKEFQIISVAEETKSLTSTQT